ncbi:MAG: tetratricopeptide repeat protein [Bacteroidetes bacterium]|nr:tetratricopeptide repeat protein [Bacteroidota bacterium]
MFSNRARILVIVVFAAMLVFFIYKQVLELALVCLLMIVLVIVEYFKQGTLVLAAKHYHDKDYAGAEALLKQIKKPEWLWDKRRGIYEYMLGNISMYKQDYEQAAIHYDLASKYPLRSVNDHVAALVHAANIQIRLGNYDKADAYLEDAMTHEEKMTAKMKAVIEKLKQELKKK